MGWYTTVGRYLSFYPLFKEVGKMSLNFYRTRYAYKPVKLAKNIQHAYIFDTTGFKVGIISWDMLGFWPITKLSVVFHHEIK